MPHKLVTTILLIFSVSISLAQPGDHYLGYGFSFFNCTPSSLSRDVNGLSEHLNRCEGTYSGVGLHFAVGDHNSISAGIGLSTIHYQKELQGIFPESGQFGTACVNGQINYWSFPISFGWNNTQRHYFLRHTCYHPSRNRFQSGFRITYVPSFEAKTMQVISTSGGADLNTFITTYQSNTQVFQHSLQLSMTDYFFISDRSIRFGIEPFIGIGSGYFIEDGTSLNNLSYGVHLSIDLHARLPISVIKETTHCGNEEEKKKLLEQKQKEIEEQLKNKPNH